MLIIDILKDAKPYTDRYPTAEAIKISVHKNLRKLITDEVILKNIEEFVDIDALIDKYKNSDKQFIL